MGKNSATRPSNAGGQVGDPPLTVGQSPGRGSISQPESIISGGRLTLGGGGDRVELTLENVKQRNWSRVAFGSLSNPAGDAVWRRVFVKQFVDAGGRSNEKQWDFEREGAEFAGRVFADIARVPVLLRAVKEPLLHVYEYCDINSLDEVLRKTPSRFDAVFLRALGAVRAVLEAIEGAAPIAMELGIELRTKLRVFGGESSAVCFKGLDIRNMGVASDVADENITMFDFGRPYLAPIEEAAAKFFVSVGLLNWGRPVRRFARGPDDSMLAAANARFGDYLSLDAVLAEIHQQRTMRERDVKAQNWWTSTLKYAGVRTLGRAYFASMERWCERQLPAVRQVV